jgi:hypothetical protein
MHGGTVILSEEQLEQLIQRVLAKELSKLQPQEKEELLSPKLARQVWKPAISLVTLAAWTKQGLLTPHYFGKKVFYKRSEIIQAAKVLKPYKSAANG